MKKEKPKMEKPKNLNIFTQIITIMSIIGQMGIVLSIFILAILAIIIPTVGNKIEIEQNTISMFNSNVQMAAVDNNLNITIAEETHSVPLGNFDFQKVIDYLQNNKIFIIISFEVTIIGSLVVFALTFMILDKVEKISKRIRTEQSPFSEENTTAVYKIAKLSLISYVVSIVTDIISNNLISNASGIDLNLSTLCTILIAYVIAYVFDYGHNLESSKH